MTEDWYKPDLYRGMTSKQFAWEFLRRNPSYIKLWELANSEHNSSIEEIKNAAHYYLIEELVDPSLNANEVEVKWILQKSVKIRNLTHEVNNIPFQARYGDIDVYLHENFHSPYVILEVDSRLSYESLEDLIRTALSNERIIQENQGSSIAKHKSYSADKFSYYLMSYDARKAKIKYLDIAKRLNPIKYPKDMDADQISNTRSEIFKYVGAAKALLTDYPRYLLKE